MSSSTARARDCRLPDPDTWPALSPSARSELAKVVALVASGFTGRVEIECNQGGVRWWRESRTHSPDEK